MGTVRFWFLAAATVGPVCVLTQNDSGARRDNGHMEWYDHMMDHWGGGFLMWLLLLVLWPFVIGMYYRLAKREEQDALNQFGQKYHEYRERTPMFFPRLLRGLSKHGR